MAEDTLEKLEDYVVGIAGLTRDSLFPVGALLVDDESRREVFDVLQKKDFVVLQDNVGDFGNLFDAVAQGKTIAISIERELSSRALNFLQGFAHGQVLAHIPGSATPRIINPIPNTTKILLVLDKALYDRAEHFNKIVSSTCRL